MHIDYRGSIPFLLNSSAAFIASETITPHAIIATSLPSARIIPLPISISSSDHRRKPEFYYAVLGMTVYLNPPIGWSNPGANIITRV